MAKRIKEAHLKAKRRNITIPQSFDTFVKENPINLSKMAQVYIAEEVTGMKFQEFETLYSTEESRADRHHASDSIVVEFIRVARWMLEGTIVDSVAVYSKEFGYEHDLDLKVVWQNGEETIVLLHMELDGFRHVIYDMAYEPGTDFEEICSSVKVFPEYGDKADICRYFLPHHTPRDQTHNQSLKFRIINRWLELSKERGTI